jgi:N-acyl-D-aspartate/D-glutamate deacylase
MRILARALIIGVAIGLTTLIHAQNFDLVIANGRVVDPESGLDQIRNIGISGRTIAAISADPLTGRAIIDAAGLVVAPGFIDLHAHGQTPETYRFQARDGVTTALELEVGTGDIDRWYAERKAGRLINYGVSIGHIPVRMAVMRDPGSFLPTAAGAHKAATSAEIKEMARRLEDGLKQGAVSMGAGFPYTPAATQEELLEVFRVAARNRVPVHVHTRRGVAGVAEALKLAAETKAPLHIVHINSTGTTATAEVLKMIANARAQGRDVTTEAYPYDAGMTEIQSANLDEYEGAPADKVALLEWPRTGERLNADTFQKYRKMGGPVVLHTNTEEMVNVAITSPLTMIASDAYWENGTGHPRTTGTYSKVVGSFVRVGS